MIVGLAEASDKLDDLSKSEQLLLSVLRRAKKHYDFTDIIQMIKECLAGLYEKMPGKLPNAEKMYRELSVEKGLLFEQCNRYNNKLTAILIRQGKVDRSYALKPQSFNLTPGMWMLMQNKLQDSLNKMSPELHDELAGIYMGFLSGKGASNFEETVAKAARCMARDETFSKDLVKVMKGVGQTPQIGSPAMMKYWMEAERDYRKGDRVGAIGNYKKAVEVMRECGSDFQNLQLALNEHLLKVLLEEKAHGEVIDLKYLAWVQAQSSAIWDGWNKARDEAIQEVRTQAREKLKKRNPKGKNKKKRAKNRGAKSKQTLSVDQALKGGESVDEVLDDNLEESISELACKDEEEKEEECPICLLDFEEGDEDGPMDLSCGHHFHQGCIQRWFEKCKGNDLAIELSLLPHWDCRVIQSLAFSSGLS